MRYWELSGVKVDINRRQLKPLDIASTIHYRHTWYDDHTCKNLLLEFEAPGVTLANKE